MFTDGIMEPGALGVQQYPDANNDFMAGKDAMVMMGTWYMQYATQAGMIPAISAAGVGNPKPFTMVAIPFPDVAGAGNPATMFGDADYGIAVSNKSSHQAAATTFATWLTTSKAGQQVVANLLNDIPSLNGIQPDWTTVKLVANPVQEPNLQHLIGTTTTSTEPRLSLVSANLQQAIGVASTTVAAGSATPAQAAATLEKTMKSQPSSTASPNPAHLTKAENVAAPTRDLSVLYLGGTGTISASCVRRSVAAGMSVYVLNRGHNVKHRSLPESVTWLQADVSDAASVRKAIGDQEFERGRELPVVQRGGRGARRSTCSAAGPASICTSARRRCTASRSCNGRSSSPTCARTRSSATHGTRSRPRTS